MKTKINKKNVVEAISPTKKTTTAIIDRQNQPVQVGIILKTIVGVLSIDKQLSYEAGEEEAKKKVFGYGIR